MISWQNLINQDKLLRKFEESQDKLFNKFFPKVGHLALYGREKLDDTETVPLAIASMEVEELHPIPEKVESLAQVKAREEEQRNDEAKYT